MTTLADERDEPDLVPPDSFVEVAPMDDGESSPLATEPDAVPAPRLDFELLAGASRRACAAAIHMAVNEPRQALEQATKARRLLDYAISSYERAALIGRLVEDTEPRLSGERDAREPEGMVAP